MIKVVKRNTKNDFSNVYKKVHRVTDVKLRSTMFWIANKNTTVAIFLEKNYRDIER